MTHERDTRVRPSESALVADSVGWDVANWSRGLAFCASRSRLQPPGTALEVGADGDNGGLSLWLAVQGWTVTCSGLEPPSEGKLARHRRHGVHDAIRYVRTDALDPLPAEAFDLVVVKSVLGAIGERGRDDLQRRAVENLHAAVRPGGELWLLENAVATPLHDLARRRIGAGRYGWRYLRLDEVDALLQPFAAVERTTFGLAGAVGRTERQRRLLGALDRRVLERVTPAGWHYIIAAVASKRAPSGDGTAGA